MLMVEASDPLTRGPAYDAYQTLAFEVTLAPVVPLSINPAVVPTAYRHSEIQLRAVAGVSSCLDTSVK